MKLSNNYKNLPKEFYNSEQAMAFSNPELIYFNENLAQDLQLELNRETPNLSDLLCGQKLFTNSQPIATVYAGHQFGNFNPQLGDGRALLLGDISHKNNTYDIQLKGSGPTKYSRGGDGLCPLGPALREYLISEAMYHLGVPTTRSLAIVGTDQFAQRETSLPATVLTRIAKSHIRIGSFEYFAAKQEFENVKLLADYSIQRHYPELKNKKNRYNLFFKSVCEFNLNLVAQWMSVGFIHGVMNTDNTTISGETIDFGPCAFMDQYNSKQVYSYIDRNGRYSYENQSKIMMWNLSCLANALFQLLINKDEEESQLIERLNNYFTELPKYFEQKYLKHFSNKLGIFNETSKDLVLINEFLQILQTHNLDFTNSFRSLNSTRFNFKDFEKKWLDRILNQNKSKDEVISLINSSNPSFIPRNHLVNKAIDDAYNNNYTLFDQLFELSKKPFQSHDSKWTSPPNKDEVISNTFCGT